MRLMTDEEKREHQKKLHAFQKKTIAITLRWMDGELTMKKFEQKKKEVIAEEKKYIEETGIFQYYGRLFIREQV